MSVIEWFDRWPRSNLKILRQLRRRVEERTEELTTLLRVSQQMTSTLDFEKLLERVLTEMEKIIKYVAASVLILEDGQLRAVCYHGPASRETVASS